MQPVPLFRRLLPWIFFGLFLVLAPTLILYSSGYRYNAKKGFLEQLGTLIVDTTPPGLDVLIDEQPTGKKTPTTFQSVHPGWHRVTVRQEGYSSWSKMLEIRPQQVTFANAIHVWKESDPIFIDSKPLCRLFSNPGRTAILFSEQSTSSQTRVSLLNRDLSSTFLSSIPTPMACGARSTWREDGQAVLLQDAQRSESLWWYASGKQLFEQLPKARFHWEGDDLVGYASGTMVELIPRNGRLTEEAVDRSIYDRFSYLRIENTTSSHQQLVIDSGLLRPKLYELPSGTWDFAERRGRYLLLRDHEEWIVIDSTAKEPYIGRITGEEPRWLPDASVPTALFRNGGELWLWPLDQSPTLVWRQTDPIVQVDWHKKGHDLFIALPKQIVSLELDERDGRLTTTLATFDQVNDMAILGADIFVAGIKDGKEGLWKVVVED